MSQKSEIGDRRSALTLGYGASVFIGLCLWLCLSVFAQQTVPCAADKCKVLDLWNQIARVEGEQFTRLEKVRASLIADPPGLVRSLDREQTLKELIAGSEALIKIYREALALETK